MSFGKLLRFCLERSKKGDSLKDILIKLSIFFELEKQNKMAKFYLKKYNF